MVAIQSYVGLYNSMTKKIHKYAIIFKIWDKDMVLEEERYKAHSGHLPVAADVMEKWLTCAVR
jgi:hypothetical protein